MGKVWDSEILAATAGHVTSEGSELHAAVRTVGLQSPVVSTSISSVGSSASASIQYQPSVSSMQACTRVDI